MSISISIVSYCYCYLLALSPTIIGFGIDDVTDLAPIYYDLHFLYFTMVVHEHRNWFRYLLALVILPPAQEAEACYYYLVLLLSPRTVCYYYYLLAVSPYYQPSGASQLRPD